MPDGRVASGFDGTERLAKRVLDGEVVFFVGSGFSIDSEGNDSRRLVGRLLAMVLAMGTVLGEVSKSDQSQARALLDRLQRIFSLPSEGVTDAAREPARIMTDANLRLLAREYYNFNDWATSALGVLSGELLALGQPRCLDATLRIQQLATFLLRLVGDTTALDQIDCRALAAFGADGDRGKALFLDTMGFASIAVMAGTPLDSDVERVAQSYGGRIRLRHHALARLAREGLAPVLVTTNYDLLLEGAYRLAGFIEREHAEAPDGTPSDELPRFSTIAGADQFFARGQGYRTALLLKVHGCAQAYRDARGKRLQTIDDVASGKSDPQALNPDVWAAYLPALVFTYREIQTWRTDAWSRDLIRTLLRTHTIVLCGYSAADPVMHSTFREVYDEKSTSRGVAVVPADRRPEGASVFFFGLARRREFHSLEILRAATVAAGLDAGSLVLHPNHIEFDTKEGFPTIDDHFRWLTHVTVRELQAEAMTTRLRRLLPRMLGHEQPIRDRDLTQLYERFEHLRNQEARAIALVHPGGVPAAHQQGPAAELLRQTAQRRLDFDYIVGWTWRFVPGFMRELALAHTIETYRGAGRAIRTFRTTTSYSPLSERPDWAAWTVIVELALRTLVAALSEEATLMPKGLRAEDSPHAALSFSCDPPWKPFGLCIRVGGFEGHDRRVPMTGAFHRITCWELGEQDVPWPARRQGACPSSAEMWSWAIGQAVPQPDEAAVLLGVQS